MPRIARKDNNTSFFHVITQGINKEFIFNKERYKKKYLDLLLKYYQEYKIKIIAYCIMNNHAHLLIYTENLQQLSLFMKKVDENFAQYYNFEEERVGYVFRSRFLSEPIYNENYLKNCLVYIHNNPVKAKLVKEGKQYLYSSYNDYFTLKNFINEEIINLIFHCSKINQQEYEKMHLDTFYFQDAYRNLEQDIKEIIREYAKNLNIEVLKYDRNLICYIKSKIQISNRLLAKFLKMDRNKIDRILKENKK